MYPLEPDDPRSIGAYRLLRRLGSGGMGRVYLGRSAGGRTVAVKLVHPHFATDTQFRARFRREVEAARRVGGAWTAPVLDADPEARVPWVATGYVAGPSLTQAVEELGALPTECVRTLGASLAEALVAVHGLGLVHRDVKPSNVLLALDGPRLIDFGIARAVDGTASLTSTGVSIGSPGYMSPEQILGRGATAAADVFSLGAVLAYAATGRPPFPGDSSASLLYKVVHEEPELAPELDGALRQIVTACLAKEPTERPTPAELVRRLAPGTGAAGLVRSGWLPAPLVEGASRRAMELLDLEAEPPGPYPAGPYGPGAAGPGGGWPAAGAVGGAGAGIGAGTAEPPRGAGALGEAGALGQPPTGPEALGPGVTGPEVLGPGVTGPEATALGATAPAVLGPGTVGGGSGVRAGGVAAPAGGAGPSGAGPAVATPSGAGPSSVDPSSAAPSGAGPGVAAPGGAGDGRSPGAFGPPDPSYGGHPRSTGGAGPVAAPQPPPPRHAVDASGGPTQTAGGAPAGQARVGGAGPADTGGAGQNGAGAGTEDVEAADGDGDGSGADRDGRSGKERRMVLAAGLGRRGRPKWLSCSLVLSVAGALAVATTAVLLVDNLQGGGSDDTSSGRGKTTAPTAGTPDKTPSPGGSGSGGTGADPSNPGPAGPATGDVPKELIGTWKGPAYAKGQYNGDHTATVRQGRKGQVVVEAVVDVFGQRCFAKGVLRSVTKENTRLTIDERPDSSKGGGSLLCTGATAHATYTYDEEEGKLVYKSDDEAGGHPVARLTKQSG